MASEELPALQPLEVPPDEWQTRRVFVRIPSPCALSSSSVATADGHFVPRPQVEWGTDGWFKGTVLHYDQSREGQCEVVYDDDDREKGKLGSGYFRVLDKDGTETDKPWRFLGPDSRANSQASNKGTEAEAPDAEGPNFTAAPGTADHDSPTAAQRSSSPQPASGSQPVPLSSTAGEVVHQANLGALPPGVTLGIPAGNLAGFGQPSAPPDDQGNPETPADADVEDQPLKSRLSMPSGKGVRKVTGASGKQVRKPAAKRKAPQAVRTGQHLSLPPWTSCTAVMYMQCCVQSGIEICQAA